MTTIEHTVTMDTLGETTPDEADQYRAAVEAAIASDYPDAEISVNLIDEPTLSHTHVCDSPDDIGIAEGVDLLANRIWDRMDWA